MSEKMKITAFENTEYTKALHGGQPLTVPYNPTSLKYTYTIEYKESPAPNNAAPEAKYKNTSPETLAFELFYDATAYGEISVDIFDEVKKLKEYIYDYQGVSHETPYVIIDWGKGDKPFKGRLKSMDITHLLFAPDGISLRAKVNLSFQKSIDPETMTKQSEKSSPDLTHRRTVAAGDTLPLMCQEVYGEMSMYLQVARANGILDFRDLELGMEISFPPLK